MFMILLNSKKIKKKKHTNPIDNKIIFKNMDTTFI